MKDAEYKADLELLKFGIPSPTGLIVADTLPIDAGKVIPVVYGFYGPEIGTATLEKTVEGVVAHITFNEDKGAKWTEALMEGLVLPAGKIHRTEAVGNTITSGVVELLHLTPNLAYIPKMRKDVKDD